MGLGVPNTPLSTNNAANPAVGNQPHMNDMMGMLTRAMAGNMVNVCLNNELLE